MKNSKKGLYLILVFSHLLPLELIVESSLVFCLATSRSVLLKLSFQSQYEEDIHQLLEKDISRNA